jgi:hypothetical protein
MLITRFGLLVSGLGFNELLQRILVLKTRKKRSKIVFSKHTMRMS